MRSREHEVPPGAGAAFAVARGVVGIGGGVAEPPGTIAEAVLAVTHAHGEKAGRMLTHFAGLPDGTFVWTREPDGAYRLGSIAGPWRYEDSAAARAVGIHHLRPAMWSPRRLGDRDVPPGVARAFSRGGRNFQRIHDPAAEWQTARHWKLSLEH